MGTATRINARASTAGAGSEADPDHAERRHQRDRDRHPGHDIADIPAGDRYGRHQPGRRA